MHQPFARTICLLPYAAATTCYTETCRGHLFFSLAARRPPPRHVFLSGGKCTGNGDRKPIGRFINSAAQYSARYFIHDGFGKFYCNGVTFVTDAVQWGSFLPRARNYRAAINDRRFPRVLVVVNCFGNCLSSNVTLSCYLFYCDLIIHVIVRQLFVKTLLPRSAG